MSIRKIPRFLLFASVLGIVVTAIMLSMFYGQYRWLSNEIREASSAEHDHFIAESFERRARFELHVTAGILVLDIDIDNSSDVFRILNRSLSGDDSLTGIRFTSKDSQSVQAGHFPSIETGGQTAWLQNNLILSYPVVANGVTLGELQGSFRLDRLRAESNHFASEIMTTDTRTRRLSYIWIGLGTLGAVLVCGFVVWLIARDQTRRIRELKYQAENLRESDFGEPIPVTHSDELGDLAAVFNTMRDRLRSTTISRDYVDSILSSMSYSIIVTNKAGKIKRINKATTQLLGYSEDELADTSIDFVIDSRKSSSIAADSATGLPREIFFESKFGESIPVSFTCSVLEGNDAESGDRICVAQNVTERRRSEQRIRYLARIDALTKIPNRMQFQHLLQRAIARARRRNRSLCLFYIDIDHFKEINDTFGHLAGDTTRAQRVPSRVRMI
ncbi:MAG: diguanylate cyclase [Proteobacteria bacterium]|nr:diguanylate cyclase [Pseudomonadota bacterium]